MICKIATVAAIAGAALTITVSAHAMDFPATPVNPGPPTAFAGEGVIPGIAESRMIINGVTQPILQPILAPGAAVGVEPAGPVARRHHRHHTYMHKKKKK